MENQRSGDQRQDETKPAEHRRAVVVSIPYELLEGTQACTQAMAIRMGGGRSRVLAAFWEQVRADADQIRSSVSQTYLNPEPEPAAPSLSKSGDADPAIEEEAIRRRKDERRAAAERRQEAKQREKAARNRGRHE